MAKKVILKDLKGTEVLPITRGELVIDSSGKQALHSNEFLATTSLPGLMSATDKHKLDNFQGDTYELSGVVSDDKYITTLTSSKGVTTNAVIEPMQGATVDLAGKVGLVPAPLAGYQNRFLSGDGTWKSPAESSLTAEDILEKLKTVDGLGSGLESEYTYMFKRVWNSSSSVIFDLNEWVNGGYIYCYGYTANLLNKPNGVTYSGYVEFGGKDNIALNGQFGWSINHQSTEDTTKALYFRASDGNGFTYSQWHQIAFTDSNVASSTKLQTPRTIWGQSFDGTNDVSGKISGTNYIAFSSGNEIYTEGGIFAINGDVHTRWLTIKDGNVGIGTQSPAYKLDVKGTLRATGGILKGSSDTPLVLDGDTTSSWISYRDSSGTHLGSIGVKNNSPVFYHKNINNNAYTTIWHEGNDGIGSGLDADLLDGKHASDFAAASALGDYVTLNTSLTITGTKTFSTTPIFNLGINLVSGNHILWDSGTYRLRIANTDDATVNTAVFTFQQSADSGSTWTDLFTIKDNGHVIANKFITSGGTSSLFVKGDGSLDSTSYATASSLGNYIKYVDLSTTSTKKLKDLFKSAGLTNKGDDSTLDDCPTNYGAFISIAYYNNKNSGFLLYADTSSQNKGIYYRTRQAGDSHTTYKDWRRVIDAGNTYINNGTITINDVSITPLTAHQSLANYVTLNGTEIISGVKTFSTLLKFTVAQGTAPFTVTSTTKVTNLNSDMVDGYHISTAGTGKPWGTIVTIGSDGVSEMGRYIDFHYDNTTGSDYSTRLLCGGNHSNSVTLPSATGTLALTSLIPTVTNYYWANVKVSSSSSTTTTPTFATATATTSVTTPLVTNSGILTLNGVSGMYLKYNNADASSLVLTNTYFKPFDAANNKLSLGTSSARWSNVYSVLGNFTGNVILYSSSGDSPHLYFLRGTTSDGTYDWDQYVTEGYFKLRYNNSGTWTEVLSAYPSSITTPWNITASDYTATTGVYRGSSTLYLDSGTSGSSIIFRIGGVEKARFAQPNGYLGILTSSPTMPLHVNGTSLIVADTPGILTLKRVSSNGGAFVDFYNNNQSTNSWRIGMSSTGEFGFAYNTTLTNTCVKSNGYFGVLTTSVTYPLTVNGTAQVKLLIISGANQYREAAGILMTNSDIWGVNAIYTADLAGGANEGYQFLRSNGNYDSIWCSDGYFYFSPNGHPVNGYSTNHTVLHSGNSSVSGGGSTWGSSITVKINGTSQTLTIPSNPNTDKYVSQSETTTTNYRPIMFGYISSSTAGSGMTTSATNVAYVSNKLYALPSTGNLYATHFYESSDINLKTNIKNIDTSDNMPLLKSFDWKSDGSHGYGLIAQELEAMGYSELVEGEEDGTKTVNYSAALSLIVGKLLVKISELEKEIEKFKNKN